MCAESQYYLEELAPFLFGNKQGAFCVLGFYMDDSADVKRKAVFSVSGLLSSCEEWFDIQRHWERRLKQEGLDYFRTYDCMSLEGEFQSKLVDRHGLTTARVIANAVLEDCKQIIRTSKLRVLCLGILMDDYRKVSAEPDGSIVLNPDPYIFAHQQLIGNVLEAIYETQGRKDIVAFLYDEHSKAVLLQNSWALFKAANPAWAQFAGTLAPLDDKVNSPIQMADLVANYTTRMFVDESRDIGLEKLKEAFGKSLFSVRYVDEPYLRAVVAENVDKSRALGAVGGIFRS